MKLFDVPTRKRVRIKSKLVRWINHQVEEIVKRNYTFEATTTDKYFHYRGARRRLLTDHTIPNWSHYGVWQRDTEAEILEDKDGRRKRTPRGY